MPLALAAAALSLPAAAQAELPAGVDVLMVEETGGGSVAFQLSDVRAVLFEEARAYLAADELLEAWWNPETQTPTGGYEYYLEFGVESDDVPGVPYGAPERVVLRLSGPAPADTADTVIPTGYYRTPKAAGAGVEEGGEMVPRSVDAGTQVWVREQPGEPRLRIDPVTGGTVDVRRDGTCLDIRMELETAQTSYAIRYFGPVIYLNPDRPEARLYRLCRGRQGSNG